MVRPHLKEPCYEASPATPLKNGKELIIGTGDDATFFYCRDDKDYDFIYLKIFVARSPIEIGFIKQSYSSQSEDKLRCFTLGMMANSLKQILLELFRRGSTS